MSLSEELRNLLVHHKTNDLSEEKIEALVKRVQDAEIVNDSLFSNAAVVKILKELKEWMSSSDKSNDIQTALEHLGAAAGYWYSLITTSGTEYFIITSEPLPTSLASLPLSLKGLPIEIRTQLVDWFTKHKLLWTDNWEFSLSVSTGKLNFEGAIRHSRLNALRSIQSPFS